MKDEKRARIQAEIARARDATQPVAPERDFRPPSGAEYTDPVLFEQELAGVFRATWWPVGRASALAEPGSYIALTLARETLAVTRGEDGALNAFHDVCQHRGARILREDHGRLDELRCPYHGFTYALDGRLRSAPYPESFVPALDEHNCRLPPASVASFAGWIWVHPRARAAPLAEYLGAELLDEWRNWPFADVELKLRRVVEAPFNWKIGVEAFLEPLHVPAIHARTVHPLVDIRAQSMQSLGRHSRMAIAFRAPNAFDLEGPMGKAAHDHGVTNFPALDEVQRTTNLSYLIFPATVLNLLPNHFTLYQMQPLEPGRTLVVYELYAMPARTRMQAEYYRSLEQGYDAILAEDLDNLAWIQRGVSDSSFVGPRLSHHERRIAHFHTGVRAARR